MWKRTETFPQVGVDNSHVWIPQETTSLSRTQRSQIPLSKLVKVGYCFHMFFGVRQGIFSHDSSSDFGPKRVEGEEHVRRAEGRGVPVMTPSLQQSLITGWTSRKSSRKARLAVISLFPDSFYICLFHWHNFFTHYLNLLGEFFIPHVRGAAPWRPGQWFTSQYPQHRVSRPTYIKPSINAYW